MAMQPESVLGNDAAATALLAHLARASDAELYHIDAYGIADKAGVDRDLMLDAMLRGVHGGLFEIEWLYHCPHCGGMAADALSVHDAHEEDFCSACKVSFENTLDMNVEVVFSAHPGYRALPRTLKDGYLAGMMDSLKSKHMFEWFKPTTIYGAHVISRPLFRELFASETLLPDQSLKISKATVLFTDIKGSTRMYETLGDSRAFRVVKEHFRILFEVIQKHRGVPIKTIGDAVMGIFQSEAEALEASFEAQRRLIAFYAAKPDAERIEVKIGLHSGPTIVVTLNGRLDYFGTTVNMAARIQGLSRPREVVFSSQLFDAPENKRVIAKQTRKILRSRVQLKGLSGEHAIYRVAFAG